MAKIFNAVGKVWPELPRLRIDKSNLAAPAARRLRAVPMDALQITPPAQAAGK